MSDVFYQIALEYARRTGCGPHKAMQVAFMAAASLAHYSQQEDLTMYFLSRVQAMEPLLAQDQGPMVPYDPASEWVQVGPNPMPLHVDSGDFGQMITTTKAHNRFMRIK